MKRLEYEGPFNNIEWKGKIVISRWSWFWKRIQFWHYKVVKQLVIDDWGKPPIRIKYLWRYK